MRKLIEIPRKYLIIMMESGYVYMAMQKPTEARELFEGVALLAPKSEVPLIGLANLLATQGEYPAALREFKKALKLAPESPLLHAHIGEILLLLHKKVEAFKEIHKAIELDPTGRAGVFAKALLEAAEKGLLPLDEPPDPADEITDPLFSIDRPRPEFVEGKKSK